MVFPTVFVCYLNIIGTLTQFRTPFLATCNHSLDTINLHAYTTHDYINETSDFTIANSVGPGQVVWMCLHLPYNSLSLANMIFRKTHYYTHLTDTDKCNDKRNAQN